MKKYIVSFVTFTVMTSMLGFGQKIKYLSNQQIYKIMEESKVHYNILSMDHLPDSLKGKSFDAILFPRMAAPISYPTLKKTDSGFTVIESRFNEDAVSFFEKAEKYYGEKNYDAAIEQYNSAIKADSTMYLAHLYLGDCYLNTEKTEEALKCYQNANRINPYDYRTSFFQATALGKLGRFEEVTEKYRDALVVKPRHNNIMLVAGKMSSLLKISVTDDAFIPKSLALKGPDSIYAYFSVDESSAWLAYALAKSVWLGEEKIDGLKEADSKAYWGTTEEKQAIIALLDAYDGTKVNEDFKQDSYLEKLRLIVADGLLDAFILYEIGSKIDPNLILRMPADVKEEVRKYISKYVLVRQ